MLKNRIRAYKYNLSHFITRWLYFTNHKDIGILYFFFGVFSSVAGTFLSLFTWLELFSPANFVLIEYQRLPGVYLIFCAAVYRCLRKFFNFLLKIIFSFVMSTCLKKTIKW